MTTSLRQMIGQVRVIQQLDFVGVYRKCDACGEVKSLEHYLRYTAGRRHALKPCRGTGYDVCAACRGRSRRTAS